MSKSEEILRPSDFINDPENCLFDEFKHNLPLNAEKVTDPKQLLGSRMRYLRTFRDMTQEEAAAKAGINTALWRHYEHGMKMPRQDRLEKIAEALSVPMQMLQPFDTYSPAGIAAVLYNMRMQCQEVEVVEMDGDTYIKVPNNEKTAETRVALKEMQERMSKVTFEDALDFYYQKHTSDIALDQKEYAKQNIEKFKAYQNGKIPTEDIHVFDEIQAMLIGSTEWFMRNQILMEYITELFQKKSKSKEQKQALDN